MTTWIGNEVIENILLNSFIEFDIEFSKLFETQATSHEERLTGYFVQKLSEKSKTIQSKIQNALQGSKGYWSFSIKYVDTSPKEKEIGADIAFVFRTNVQDKMRRKKVILVQCKKMKRRIDADSGFTFYPSWTIDSDQIDDLCNISPFSYYFLYGPHSLGILTRVIPAQSVKGIMDATNRKTTIPLNQTKSSSRPFPKFFLHDFIGCWVGDECEKTLKLVEDINSDISFRYLVNVDLFQE